MFYMLYKLGSLDTGIIHKTVEITVLKTSHLKGIDMF